MKIALSITNHNQNSQVKDTLRRISRMSRKPDRIFVCSDGEPFVSTYSGVTPINNTDMKGRCRNRNSVIPEFIKSGCDALVFIDGDSCPRDEDFFEKYEELFNTYDLVFGTREHGPVNGLVTPPSDLLTANMDNLWAGRPLDSTDLRVAAGAVTAWQKSRDFYERLDLMSTGMIGWSCNFGFTKASLGRFLEFMDTTYGRAEIFDSGAFNGKWGYEDVAMGIDALYAGLKIWISDEIVICHRAHERSDGLFDHVVGRHAVMERIRGLEKQKKIRNLAYTAMGLLFGTYILGVITGMFTMFLSLWRP